MVCCDDVFDGGNRFAEFGAESAHTLGGVLELIVAHVRELAPATELTIGMDDVTERHDAATRIVLDADSFGADAPAVVGISRDGAAHLCVQRDEIEVAAEIGNGGTDDDIAAWFDRRVRREPKSAD